MTVVRSCGAAADMVSGVFAESPPIVAATCVLPFATAVASPVELIVETLAELDDQLTWLVMSTRLVG